MKRGVAAVISLLVVLSVASVLGATCGSTAVCGDTSATLVGEIIFDAVELEWSTDDENSSIGTYKIKRYNCGNPNLCSVDVATVSPAGSCGTTHTYSYTDYPPAPVASWTYSVEVIRTDGSRACAVDVVPQ